MKIEIEMSDLKRLLDQQKEIVAQRLLSCTYLYNTESEENNMKSLPIDRDKFTKRAVSADYPVEFSVLQKYLPVNPH